MDIGMGSLIDRVKEYHQWLLRQQGLLGCTLKLRGVHGDFSGTQVTPVTEDRTTAPFLELGNYAISRHSWMLADGEAARQRRRGRKQSEWSASWVSLSLVRVTLDSLCPSLLNPVSICVWLLTICTLVRVLSPVYMIAKIKAMARKRSQWWYLRVQLSIYQSI